MSFGKRVASTIGLSLALVVLGAGTAFAHDCFNPQKNAHAPWAGVHYEITGFDQNGPIIEQVGTGKGVGGFLAISGDVVGSPNTLFVHSIGNSSSHEEVGGPGSHKANHACDGKGIDYLDACFGG